MEAAITGLDRVGDRMLGCSETRCFRSKSASTTEVRRDRTDQHTPAARRLGERLFCTAYGNRRWCARFLIERLYVQPGVGRCVGSIPRSGRIERPTLRDFSLPLAWARPLSRSDIAQVSCASIFPACRDPPGVQISAAFSVEPEDPLMQLCKARTSTSGHSFEGERSSTVAASTNGNWMIRLGLPRQPQQADGEAASIARRTPRGSESFSVLGPACSGRHGGSKKVGMDG